uniref:Phosphatidylethanolamine N-methyltransferase n=1 Tax=Sinocyclocheilus anshuiensis TaxID=1608454 RepID=A0A671LUI3_9TELE
MHVLCCTSNVMRVRAYMLLMCFVVSLSPQMDMSVLAELWRLTDLTEPRFCVAVIAIIFNPFFWNVVSHYLKSGLTRLFGGPYVACYSFAVLILNASPIGVILTALVGLSYKVAIAFEGHQKAMQA